MSQVVTANLRCEYHVDPIGLDERQPRLSWLLTVPDHRRGVKQLAYRVLVASSAEKLLAGEGDFWDSGKVCSDRTSQVEYAGKAIGSRQRAWWTVRAWDEKGVPSDWAPAAFWEMGLLSRDDWTAQWIGSSIKDGAGSSPCPYFRKTFKLRGGVARARLYATALGLYEMWINGQRVGDRHFTPGWTDYAVRLQYQTYDVTAMMQAGDNAMGGILGDGWYCGFLGWEKKRDTYGCQKQLLAQLVVDYEDGTSQTIATDRTWKCATGPILESDIYSGEIYDARLEMAGWSLASFRDAIWRKVKLHAAPAAKLVASASPPVRQTGRIQPCRTTQPRKGVFIFDMGQNMVGYVRLKVPDGTRRGTKIVIRHAEFLNPDGTLYTTNLRAAKCTDTYIVKGRPQAEFFEPHFTFHGFRYVEISGLSARPALGAVTGVVLHSDTAATGSFECSNAMLNQLQHNILWGQKGNFLDVPTDCPQRNERLGWTGDAQVFIRTACFNMDVAGFFNKWLMDLTDAQSPSGALPMVAPDVLAKKQGDGGAGWADAVIICPWTTYLAYGDTRVLQRHYKAMAKYIDFLGCSDFTTRHCFGDWLNQNDPTPDDLIATAYWAYCTGIMAEVAGLLGKKADAAKYTRLLGVIREKFSHEFVTASGRLASSSQTGYVLALHFGLLPQFMRAEAVKRLVRRIGECKDRLSTGFIGTPYLLSALADNGKLDLAYKLLLNEDFPSWGYPIKHGATTMWERWDGWRHDKGFQDPGMNSFNHYAYGAVGDWMYRNIGGIDIDPARPAYRHIIVRPRIGGGLTHARAEIDTIHGRVETKWRLTERNLTLAVQVPPNCTATVYVPGAKVTEGRRPAAKSHCVKQRGQDDGASVFQIGSGFYEFRAKLPS